MARTFYAPRYPIEKIFILDACRPPLPLPKRTDPFAREGWVGTPLTPMRMEEDKVATREYSPEITWRCHADEPLGEGLGPVGMTNGAGGGRSPSFDAGRAWCWRGGPQPASWLSSHRLLTSQSVGCQAGSTRRGGCFLGSPRPWGLGRPVIRGLRIRLFTDWRSMRSLLSAENQRAHWLRAGESPYGENSSILGDAILWIQS